MADYLGPEIFTEAKVDSWWRQAQGQLNVLHELAEEHLLESVTPAKAQNKRPLPVVHIVAISLLLAVVGVAFLYMGDDEPALSPSGIAANPAPKSIPSSVAASATANSSAAIELASTQTPVQPLMQSLPQPQQPNQQVQQQAAQTLSGHETNNASGSNATVAESVTSEIAKEEVVPLAQLPTAPPKPVNQTTGEIAKTSGAAQPVTTSPAKAISSPASVQTAPVATAKTDPVPKQEPAPKPVNKPVQQSASAQERNILGWKPNEYTIQLVGVSNQKAALDFIAAQPNKNELLMFKSKRAGKDWFVVITGRFANSAQARQAIKVLPAVQRDAGPWPRDVKTIQAEIKTAM